MEKRQPIIEFTDFGFKYNAQTEPTLFNINLKIYPGEKILIAGPSGSGKSTIGHCINGLIPFSYMGDITGSVMVAGKETRELSLFEISRTVGTVLQDSDAQFVGLTVAEDIAFALENQCLPQSEMLVRVAEAAGKVDVLKVLSHTPFQLSGGQKQRVSLAGVMIDDVDILLFDEPLANLDPATGKQAIELIDNIQKQTGAAVIIIEHRIEDVLYRDVDRIILVDEGHIVVDESPDNLLCGEKLKSIGLREPLFITAMKYSGIEITPEMHPGRIDTLELDGSGTEKVREWFDSISEVKTPEEGVVLFEADNIDFAYDNSENKILKDISMKIHRGEIICIVGQNGAGKSTFSKLICGFEHQQNGVMYLNGKDMTDMSIKERADHIGYVMQDPNQMICKNMISEEVGLALTLDGVPEEQVKEKVLDTLKICGLYPFRNWPISALSFGQKKRVTIASILSTDPEIVILDEPTAGQDFRHYTEIMEFLKSLGNRGISVVMITHDMHLMLEYSTRAVVFTDGEIIADDTPASILTNPDLIDRSSLKETSLYPLAILCGISNPTSFVQRFIDYDREVRR